MPNLAPRSLCTGCTACQTACPYGAISMSPDILGFLYPIVDASKCRSCGLCEKSCVIVKGYDTIQNFDNPICYAARHREFKEVRLSRSGAVFAALSDVVLDKGGVVYGVGYKDHFRVAHKRACTRKERDEFRGSKYVQSDLSGVFGQVKHDLENGLWVLFSGTPCQTAGLRAAVNEQLQKNLICVDIICHGVPSPYIWRDFLNYIEAKTGRKVVAVNFRDKVMFGWSDHKETFKFSGWRGVKIWFTDNFYKHIFFRRSCSECIFSNTRRPSDITLGDFWGCEKVLPAQNQDDMGMSFIMTNSDKGREILDLAHSKLNLYQVSLADGMQPNLQRPTHASPMRDEFEEDYSKYGFRYIYSKYANEKPPLKQRILFFIKTYIKVALRMIGVYQLR